MRKYYRVGKRLLAVVAFCTMVTVSHKLFMYTYVDPRDATDNQRQEPQFAREDVINIDNKMVQVMDIKRSQIEQNRRNIDQNVPEDVEIVEHPEDNEKIVVKLPKLEDDAAGMNKDLRQDVNINEGKQQDDSDKGENDIPQIAPPHEVVPKYKDDTGADVKEDKWKDVTYPPFLEFKDENELGEFGAHSELKLDAEQQKESVRVRKLNDFNQYLSDRISVHRQLYDQRDPGCKDIKYPSDLPNVSVIVCFHNEAWSVLLRTVHSILDRSPPEMLEQVILVDDMSTMEHLKAPLEKYMSQYPKVKVVHAQKREGLTRARLLGYDVATAPILVFLDSHIECFPGWLEPLIARIAADEKIITVPMIPTINKNTFELHGGSAVSLGIFRWNGLTFTWRGLKAKEQVGRRMTDPIKSPTMPGGLFAISKHWFTTLGTYDPGLDYWGGENIELSFKSWMCNGSLEMVPCSNVGHIFRDTNPISWPVANVVNKNSIRVAEVWMDEYKELMYDHSFNKAKEDVGDVSDRIRLRQSLHCHDFKWYVTNVLDDELPPDVIAKGEIRSKVNALCLDSMGKDKPPALHPCHGLGGNQWWVLTEGNYLMQNLKRLCVKDMRLTFDPCKPHKPYWNVSYEDNTIQHDETGHCLEMRLPRTVVLTGCTGANNQKWILPPKKES